MSRYFLIFLWFAFLSETCPAADSPNILWVVSEDNDVLLGCYGDPLAHTPNLDKLAREGVLYERCFSWPVCAPSRFALITGLYPTSCGPAEHMRAQGKVPPWLKGFPALLREKGYFTSNNAKTDYNAPIPVGETWSASGKTGHWRLRAGLQQPFFSVFNHEVTHESCLFPTGELPLDFKPMDPSSVRIPPYQPDTPEIRADWVRYYNHMRLMDAQIGAKLRDLESDGLAENTIVFYYSDNGGVLPRSKRFLQESGTHVPLIVYFPPKWRHLAPAPPGSRIREPVSFVDFAPTVLSLAGVNVPAYMEGRPFAGASRGRPNEFVFSSRDRMDTSYDMMRSAMDSRWLYIRNYRPDLPYVQPLEYMFKARGYQSWARMAEEGKLTAATSQFWGAKPSEELYDMQNDPHSVHNLVKSPEHHATLERMRSALQTHLVETRDNGFLPEGSVLEGYEPSRAPHAWDVNATVRIANLASERDPANLPAFINALSDSSEPVRWWGAQGCTVLGKNSASAQGALLQALQDPSGAVQIAAAEALAAIGNLEAALPVLNRWILSSEPHGFIQLAANVMDRLGERARPSLAVMKEALSKSGEASAGKYPPQYQLNHAVAVLEGAKKALVYPSSTADQN